MAEGLTYIKIRTQSNLCYDQMAGEYQRPLFG